MLRNTSNCTLKHNIVACSLRFSSSVVPLPSQAYMWYEFLFPFRCCFLLFVPFSPVLATTGRMMHAGKSTHWLSCRGPTERREGTADCSQTLSPQIPLQKNCAKRELKALDCFSAFPEDVASKAAKTTKCDTRHGVSKDQGTALTINFRKLCVHRIKYYCTGIYMFIFQTGPPHPSEPGDHLGINQLAQKLQQLRSM